MAALVVLTLSAVFAARGRAQTAYFSAVGSTVASGFNRSAGVTVDAIGNVYVTDSSAGAVYKETFSGGAYAQSTVASGFSQPVGVAVDVSGNVYVSDQGTNTVYKETLSGGTYTQGTVASGFSKSSGVAVDASGNVYIIDQGTSTVYKEKLSSGVYTQSAVASTTSPVGVAVDASGNVYIADQSTNSIYEEVVSGASYTRSTIASGFELSVAVAVDASGNVYIADQGANTIYKETLSSGSYTQSTVASGFIALSGVAAGASGNVYAADQSANAVYDFQTAGVNFNTVAVNGVNSRQSLTFTFTAAGTINTPSVLTMGATGLDFADAGTGSCDTNGTSHSYGVGNSCAVDVTFTPKFAGLRMGAVNLLNSGGAVIATAYVYGTGAGPMIGFPPGTITTLAGNGQENYSGDKGQATSATMNTPWGTALDGAGNVYIADFINNVIREVNVSTGVITTVAGDYSLSGTDGGYNGSSGPATSMELNYPQGLAVDGAGNLYISDGYNDVIRMVTPASEMTTVAGSGYFEACGDQGYTGDGGPATSAQLNCPMGVAIDGAGNLYISDQENNVIREVNRATGIITTVAGNSNYGYRGDNGPAVNAELSNPAGVAVDAAGNVYIADTYNSVIRKVTAATGVITTVAGNGNSGYTGDNGAAIDAQLNYPGGVSVDGFGNIYIADTNNSVIREVNAATGIITTLAGNGKSNYTGDNGPATSAEMNNPNGLAVDGAGSLFIADTNNNRVRKVNVAGPPSLSFDTTTAGSTSADSPKTVTVENLGNEPLIFGSDPSISSNFGLANSTCNNGDSVAADTTCSVQVNFSPLVDGNPLTGSVMLTDNALNAASPSYAMQTIALSGVAVGGPPSITALSPYYALVGQSPTVIITGSNFTGASAVHFGAYGAYSFTVNSDTQITATPQAATNAGTVNVTVTVGTIGLAEPYQRPHAQRAVGHMLKCG